MGNAITNPLYGLKVGSVAFGEPAHFGAPVLGPGVTKFIAGQSGEISMSGSSEYVYSDKMNQGSFGATGSYGISGIARFSGKLSSYYGHTQANSGKTLSIMMNTTDWAGVEYLDFNDLSAAQLMAALSAGPRAKLTAALNKFVAMQKALGSDPAQLVDGQGALKPEAKAWVLAVEDFYRSCGTGFVMGVLWGGWGTAKLEFHTAGDENRWKYGGAGNFTYAGTGAAVSISAVYGGSQSTIGQNASAKITVFYNGACVQPKVEKWFQDLNDIASKGLSALGSTEVTRNATLAAPIEAPTIPDFVAPRKDPKVTDLFKEIKGLDGLKAYAQAAAWQKQVASGKTESLHDFLNKAGEKNDVSGVPDKDTLSPLTDLPGSGDESRARLVRAEPRATPVRDEPPKPADVSRYEPLGVWVVNWAQLFPWLVTGHDNAVTRGARALEWVRLKTLHQDCLSLTRLYDRLDGEGCSLLMDGKAVDFRGIRDSFSRVAGLVADFLSTRPTVKVVPDKIRSFIAQLSSDARTIYSRWDEVPQFRWCELGAGIVLDTINVRPELPASTVGDLKLQGSRIEIQRKPSDFKFPEYSSFARCGKAWPFIAPNGKILAFVSVGSANTSGILTIRADTTPRPGSEPAKCYPLAVAKQTLCPTWEPWDFQALRRITPGPEYALPFTWDGSAPPRRDATWPFGALFAQYLDYHKDAVPGDSYPFRTQFLHPIPFDAAVGISDWKGSAMATGMGSLGKDLKAIKDELSRLNRCTFDSDFWEGVSFTEVDEAKDLFYSMEMMKLSYIGVTDEPPNIMPGR